MAVPPGGVRYSSQTVRYRHTKNSHVTDFGQSHAWIFYSEQRLNIYA